MRKPRATSVVGSRPRITAELTRRIAVRAKKHNTTPNKIINEMLISSFEKNAEFEELENTVLNTLGRMERRLSRIERRADISAAAFEKFINLYLPRMADLPEDGTAERAEHFAKADRLYKAFKYQVQKAVDVVVKDRSKNE